MHTFAAADPDLPSGGYPVRASLVVAQRNKKRLIHNQSCLGAAFVSTWLNKQIFAEQTNLRCGDEKSTGMAHTVILAITRRTRAVLHTARAIDLDLPSSCRAAPRGLVPGHPKYPLWIRHCFGCLYNLAGPAHFLSDRKGGGSGLAPRDYTVLG